MGTMPMNVEEVIEKQRASYEAFAIYAVDPGTTSGVSRGTFIPVHGGSLRDHLVFGLYESWEVDSWQGSKPGRTLDARAKGCAQAAWEIVEEFKEWQAHLYFMLGYQPTRVHFVMESFALRTNKARGAGSDAFMLDPLRVASGIEEGILNQRSGTALQVIEYQNPSDIANQTSERLKRNDLWVVGSEHRRDSNRHMALKLSKLIG